MFMVLSVLPFLVSNSTSTSTTYTPASSERSFDTVANRLDPVTLRLCDANNPPKWVYPRWRRVELYALFIRAWTNREAKRLAESERYEWANRENFQENLFSIGRLVQKLCCQLAFDMFLHSKTSVNVGQNDETKKQNSTPATKATVFTKKYEDGLDLKARAQHKPDHDHEETTTQVDAWAAEILIPDEKTKLDDESQLESRVRRLCSPLKRSGSMYSFLHKSIQEYFTALHVARSIAEFELELPDLETYASSNTAITSDPNSQLQDIDAKEQMPPHAVNSALQLILSAAITTARNKLLTQPLSKKLLTDDYGVLRFAAEFVDQRVWKYTPPNTIVISTQLRRGHVSSVNGIGTSTLSANQNEIKASQLVQNNLSSNTHGSDSNSTDFQLLGRALFDVIECSRGMCMKIPPPPAGATIAMSTASSSATDFQLQASLSQSMSISLQSVVSHDSSISSPLGLPRKCIDASSSTSNPLITRAQLTEHAFPVRDDALAISVAAANALTVLNAAGVRLAYRDFSFACVGFPAQSHHLSTRSGLLKLPVTDLSCALLSGCNFSNAQLGGVRLENCVLDNCNFDDADLWGVALGQKPILQGHTDSVSSLATSSDGKYLFSGSSDATICQWSIDTGDSLRTLQGHTSSVLSLAISSDGKYLFSGSSDATIRQWSIETGDSLRTLQGHTDSVLSLAISSDGKYLFSGSSDKTIRQWSIETGDSLRTLQGHTSSVRSLAISSDGKYLFSGSYDATIRQWSIETGDSTERSLEAGEYPSLSAGNGCATVFTKDGLCASASGCNIITGPGSSHSHMHTVWIASATAPALSAKGALLHRSVVEPLASRLLCQLGATK